MKVQMFLEQPLRLFIHCQDHLLFHKHSLVKQLLNSKELDFSAQSVKSLPRHYKDFKCF